MFYLDSLFTAVAPLKPVAVFVDYQLLTRNEQNTFSEDAYIHDFTVDGN